MKVILIIPPALFLEDPRKNPQLGIMYLSAYLKQHGIDVECYDLLEDCAYLNTVRNLPSADFYGISFLTPQYKETKEIVEILKKEHPESKIVAGGAHVSSLWSQTISQIDFDFLIRDEGEVALLRLAQNKSLDTIPGLVYRKNGFLHNNLINRIENIDSLPFPDRQCVPEYNQEVQGKKSTSIITSRGCPYRCAFCSKALWGQAVRHRSAKNVLEEVEILVKNYQALVFVDETFTLDKVRLREILNGLKKHDIIFRCWTRTDKVNKEDLQKMKEAGCRQIEFGIESGSQEMLDRMNKRTTVKQNKQAILNARKVGIYTKAYLILGLPGETRESIEATKRFIQDSRPDQVLLSSFTPLPGSAIWNNPGAYGVKILEDLSQYYQAGVNKQGGLSCEINTMTTAKLSEERATFQKFLKKEGIAL